MQMVKVQDITVLPGKKRVHEIAGVGYVTFECGSWQELPLDKVGRLISIPEGFRVETLEGLPLSNVPVEVQGQSVALRTDQVIAELGELTREALADRVEAATGKAPAKTVKRDELIASLVRIRAGLNLDEGEDEGAELV